MLGTKPEAIDFAVKIASRLTGGAEAAKIREAASTQSEHKVIRECVEALLHETVAGLIEWEWLPGGTGFRFDYEGRKRGRTERQEHSYAVLGTWAHPDAAILAPFTVAFEFDRESATDTSHFKTCLMKAAVHVLSGAYDACVFVFTLTRRESNPKAYLEPPDDDNSCTRHLMNILRSHGLVVEFVSPE